MTSTRPRLTSAGRLLADIAAQGRLAFTDIAPKLGVRVETLEACARGTRTLELEVQMRLAALTLLLAPEHGRAATRLYEQAQAALRVDASAEQRHPTYPRELFR